MKTGSEAERISGRSESWLRKHSCAWCDQTLLRVLRHGCAAMYEKCDPTQKDFSSRGELKQSIGIREK